jgi:hypothetical protein
VPDAVEPEDLMRLIARVALYKAALERIAENDSNDKDRCDLPEDAPNACPECLAVELAMDALENG